MLSWWRPSDEQSAGCIGSPVLAQPDSPDDRGVNFACRCPDFSGLAGNGEAFCTFLNWFNKLPPFCELGSPYYPAQLVDLGLPLPLTSRLYISSSAKRAIVSNGRDGVVVQRSPHLSISSRVMTEIIREIK